MGCRQRLLWLWLTLSEASGSSVGNVTVASEAPSWNYLAAQAEATPTGARLRAELTEREAGGGPPHTDAKLRLFGERKEDVRVVFYRDSAGWCPYCQKVKLPPKMLPALCESSARCCRPVRVISEFINHSSTIHQPFINTSLHHAQLCHQSVRQEKASRAHPTSLYPSTSRPHPTSFCSFFFFASPCLHTHI